MAIKVGGTTVIDDSRALNNITSVDATTVAALGTAGVGGGGGSFDMTATGSITAGKVVALNSNGTVSAVVNQAGDPATSLSQATNNAIRQRTPFSSHAVDDARQRVVRVYLDQNNNNYGTAVCGQIDTTGNITWGTPVVFQNSSLDCNLVVVYHKNNLDYYVFMKDPGNNQPKVTRMSNTGGTSLTVGSSYSNPGSYGYCSSEGYAGVYDPDQQRVVFVWFSTGQNEGAAASFSSGLSASVLFSASNWSQYSDMTYDTANNKAVFLWQYSANNTVRAHVITVQASSIAVASAVNTSFNGGAIPRCTFDPDSGKVIAISSSTGDTLRYGMGTVSGTSSSWTNGTISSSGVPNTQGQYDLTYDTGADKLLISYRKWNTQTAQMRQGSISGTTLTLGSEVETYSSASTDFMRLDYLPTSGVAVMTANISASNNNLGSAVTSVIASTNSSWFGVADESISSGSAGKITHIGGINESVSGLTTGVIYYADKVGGLSSTSTGFKVGKALSATKLLITEGNA